MIVSKRLIRFIRSMMIPSLDRIIEYRRISNFEYLFIWGKKKKREKGLIVVECFVGFRSFHFESWNCVRVNGGLTKFWGSFWWNAENHHVSSRTPGLRARWLAFNETVVRASLRLNFADAPLFVSIWVRVCSMTKLIHRAAESERRCAFRLGITNNWSEQLVYVIYFRTWIVGSLDSCLISVQNC